MKKICITGGAGMIGSRLVRKLVSLQFEVVVIDNLWRGKLSYLENIPGFEISPNTFFNIDLSKPQNKDEIIGALKDCHAVVHLADIVAGIGYVFNNQYEIFKINNEINSLTFSCCVEAGVKRIIYAGTACSFPKNLQMSLDSVLKEDMLFPAEPESAYGWSKLMGTLELTYLAQQHNIYTTTLMLHNVYGPNCDIDPKRSQVIPSIIRRILELNESDPLVVWGTGKQGRAFLHVDDVVNGIISALDKPNLPSIIQLGPNYCTSIKELASLLIEKIFKKPITITYDLTKPEGDIGRCADFSLANQVLDWAPNVSLESGLLETADWIRHELNKLDSK
ncbi:MAG: NAD-dependent epimerase/dehydratase family protein [Sediminibacterium sp.]